MEIAIHTNKNGRGQVTVEEPVHDAVITRGWGDLVVKGSTITVTLSAPNDAVGVEYADEPDHQLLCPFCMVPLAPHQICHGASLGAHPIHIRPVLVHHISGGLSVKGQEQAAAARATYRHHKISS